MAQTVGAQMLERLHGHGVRRVYGSPGGAMQMNGISALIDYARYDELLGLTGIRVDRPEDAGPAWDEALPSGSRSRASSRSW